MVKIGDRVLIKISEDDPQYGWLNNARGTVVGILPDNCAYPYTVQLDMGTYYCFAPEEVVLYEPGIVSNRPSLDLRIDRPHNF